MKKTFKKFIYQVRAMKTDEIKAVFCLEQDANEYVAKNGGYVYQVGAM